MNFNLIFNVFFMVFFTYCSSSERDFVDHHRIWKNWSKTKRNMCDPGRKSSDVKEHAVTGYILLVDKKDVVVDYLNVLYHLFSARNEVFSGN